MEIGEEEVRESIFNQKDSLVVGNSGLGGKVWNVGSKIL